MSDLLNMTERTSERIASLEAQIEELRLLMLKNMENDNSFLSENVEPLPIGSGGGGGNKKPFDYQTRTEGEGESALTVHEIVNNRFYWDGSLKYISDYEFARGNLAPCTIYLSGVRNGNSSTWTWSLGTEWQEAPSGGDSLNFKLYDFLETGIEMDYRDTFLTAADAKICVRGTVSNEILRGNTIKIKSGTYTNLSSAVTKSGDDVSIALTIKYI